MLQYYRCFNDRENGDTILHKERHGNGDVDVDEDDDDRMMLNDDDN